MALTQKQMKFAHLVLDGVRPIKAYEQAGYICLNKNAGAVGASRLLNSVSVAEYMEGVWARAASEFKLPQRMAMLARIAAREEKEDPQISIRAIAEINKLEGAYAPIQTQAVIEMTELKPVINITAKEPMKAIDADEVVRPYVKPEWSKVKKK